MKRYALYAVLTKTTNKFITSVVLESPERLCYAPESNSKLQEVAVVEFDDKADNPKSILEDRARHLFKEYLNDLKDGNSIRHHMLTNELIFAFKCDEIKNIPPIHGLAYLLLYLPEYRTHIEEFMKHYPKRYAGLQITG